jgi:hypothetical protein
LIPSFSFISPKKLYFGLLALVGVTVMLDLLPPKLILFALASLDLRLRAIALGDTKDPII